MFDKIKIFIGPNDYDFKTVYFEEANEMIVGVDSGCEYLVHLDKEIDLAVGDFDSIDPKVFQVISGKCKHIIRLNEKKDMTDLAYALDYLYNHVNYRTIEIFGGISGRVDHFIANLNLMKKYRFSMRDNHHYMYILDKGTYQVDNFKKYISFFAIEDVYGLTLTGFKYPLDSYFLSTSDSLSVSNEGSGVVSFAKGKLLIIMSEDRHRRKEQ